MKKTHKEDRISLVREFPDRAIRWLLETPDNLRGLLLTINKDIAERIDYKNIERIERTFIEDDFRKREADILFKAKFLDDTGESLKEFIIYVLIEHQSSVDPIMPFRILYYMTQIWEAQRREWESQKVPSKDWRFRPILPVVFYTGKEKWNSPLEMKNLMELPSLLEDFAPQLKIMFFNLKAISTEQLVKNGHPFEWVLQIIQKEGATFDEFGKALHSTIQNLISMRPEEQANWEKLMFFLVEFIRHRRKQIEQPELFNIIISNIEDVNRREEVRNMSKTGAQALIEEGMEKGMEKGMELGLIKAKQEDLINLLSIRFSTIPSELTKKIKSIRKIDKLDTLFVHAIKADELNEIEIELKN
jgi:predicted transposase/invertase (TIGR01784 family)